MRIEISEIPLINEKKILDLYSRYGFIKGMTMIKKF